MIKKKFGIFFLALTSCLQSTSNLVLKVHAKSNDGKPLAGASVFLADKQVGVTDQAGNFHLTDQFPSNEPLELKIEKQNPSSYVAPFVTQIDLSHKTNMRTNINAVLYTVPKTAQLDKAEAPAKDTTPLTPKSILAPSTSPQTDADPLTSAVLSIAGSAIENKAPQTLPIVEPTHSFTIYSFNGENPLAGVEIYYGNAGQGRYHTGCVTNQRGRCVIRTLALAGPLTIMARKENFQTTTSQLIPSDDKEMRFNLIRGMSLDVFAVAERYNHSTGASGIEIQINGKAIGNTDAFGHLSYQLHAISEIPITLSFASKDYAPEQLSSDIVISGPTSIVKYYTPKVAPKVKLALIDNNLITLTSNSPTSDSDRQKSTVMTKIVMQRILAKGVFIETPLDKISRFIAAQGVPLSDLIRSGWQDGELKSDLDAIVLATLHWGQPSQLTLSVVGSKGRLLFNASRELPIDQADKQTTVAIDSLIDNLLKKFPFEGAVIANQDPTEISVNMGSGTGHLIAKNDLFALYSCQYDEVANPHGRKKIGWGHVTQVSATHSIVHVDNLDAGAVINIGDLVEFRGANQPADEMATNINTAGANAINNHQSNRFGKSKTTL